jgi:hypothetical protein
VDTRCCKSCDREFVPCPRVKNQQYCSDRACQQARKRLWQKEKLGRDKDYRLNQKAAQEVWRAKNSGYWKDYRDKHPQYVKANRENQRKRRDLKPQGVQVAKMDASQVQPAIIPGRYQLVLLTEDLVAKMDAINVELRVLSVT